MNARRGRPATMVLPPHDRASGEVTGDYRDERVPRPLGRFTDDERTPQVLAFYRRSEHCPEGRHLFDVIESVQERETFEPDDDADHVGMHGRGRYGLEQTFRARLTCVRCGIIEAWAGVRDGDVRSPASVIPAPLAAGELLAQQISGDSSGLRDMSTWAVYHASVQVGLITWARGPRGRAYYVGRIDGWPDGQPVEADAPAGVLRAMWRRSAQTLAGADA